MLAPISWRTPPRHYGPWELVTSLLTEGLVERGVDVTLFATADSETGGRLEAVCPRPISEDPTLDAKVWECLHIANLFDRAAEFDLIHNQFDFLPLTYAGLVDTPMVTTIHGFSSEQIVPVYERYNQQTAYVSISDADRHPRLTYAATVYHGIDARAFPFSEGKGDHLLFWGRMHPDKGAAEAIEVARRAGRRLVMAGIVQDERYFREKVVPHVDGDRVQYVGPIGVDERAQYLGSAAALLHLINFDEPFGLSVVEAMMCGTPVVAVKRGSMGELVRDGVTGVLVEGIDGAVAAVPEVVGLDRWMIREEALAKFSRERMVDDYLRVYARMLGRDGSCP
jgi:glycosyltransferase involved in cell wall biosynthesis